jgi:hypothetical protein
VVAVWRVEGLNVNSEVDLWSLFLLDVSWIVGRTWMVGRMTGWYARIGDGEQRGPGEGHCLGCTTSTEPLVSWKEVRDRCRVGEAGNWSYGGSLSSASWMDSLQGVTGCCAGRMFLVGTMG